MESILRGPRPTFSVPPSQTIAHQLIRHWIGMNSNLWPADVLTCPKDSSSEINKHKCGLHRGRPSNKRSSITAILGPKRGTTWTSHQFITGTTLKDKQAVTKTMSPIHNCIWWGYSGETLTYGLADLFVYYSHHCWAGKNTISVHWVILFCFVFHFILNFY